MIGESLGSYVIERKLGEGGMGEVYLAAHRRIERRVAIKVLLPEHSRDQSVIERFFTEARATSLIDHPNIVEVLDCDVRPSGRAYIVMEYLRGESLAAALLRVGDLRNDRGAFWGIAEQVVRALGAAHAKGIVHRDLKPDNVFLSSKAGPRGAPTVKILDFGIAKLAKGIGAGGSKTKTGSLMGTPLYMSPEQCRGSSSIDLRSDIYSLGCMLYEMTVGRPPFVHEGFGDLIIAHASTAPTPPSKLGVALPGGLEALLLAMLAKDPAERPASMADVDARLQAVAASSPPGPSRLVLAEGEARAADAPVRALEPAGSGAARVGQTTLSRGAAEAASAVPPRRRTGRVAAAIGGAVAAAVAVGVVTMRRPAVVVPAVAPMTATAPAAQPTPAPAAVIAPPPASAPSAPAPPIAPSPAPPAEAQKVAAKGTTSGAPEANAEKAGAGHRGTRRSHRSAAIPAARPVVPAAAVSPPPPTHPQPPETPKKRPAAITDL